MSISRRDLLIGSTALLSTASLAGLPGSARTAPRADRWQLPTKIDVDVVEHEWIPMTDGTRLSAKLWPPRGASLTKAPVVLEYIPYRKRDLYRMYDDAWGLRARAVRDRLRACRCARLRRIRGRAGRRVPRHRARGRRRDHRLAGEAGLVQRFGGDARDLVGGINTLQVAALAPPALKAIMPMCCTDTRYTDDAHYIGGALLGLTDLQWERSSRRSWRCPPTRRSSASGGWTCGASGSTPAPPILERWLTHQRNDAYWQRGSVSMDYRKIRCPTYIVDGWVDTYLNTVTRILAGLSVPRKGLIGPWAHQYPQGASPGPGLDWAYEEVRWWEALARGRADRDHGRADAARLHAVPDRVGRAYPADTPGRWIAEPAWPSPAIHGAHVVSRRARPVGQPRPREQGRLRGDESSACESPSGCRSRRRGSRASRRRTTGIRSSSTRRRSTPTSRFSAIRSPGSALHRIARSRSSRCACARSRPMASRGWSPTGF